MTTPPTDGLVAFGYRVGSGPAVVLSAVELDWSKLGASVVLAWGPPVTTAVALARVVVWEQEQAAKAAAKVKNG